MKINKKYLIIIGVVGFAGFIVAAFLLLSGPRMRHQASLRAYEFNMRKPPEDAVAFAPGKADTIQLHYPGLNEQNLYKGKIYYQYYCVFCHGEDGKGNGSVGQSYFPKPADITVGYLRNAPVDTLHALSFFGTGHAPVLEQVIPAKHVPYLLLYVKEGFGVNQ